MRCSGLAFRVRWFRGHTDAKWCPSSPVGEVPEPMGAFEQATGWRFRQHWPWGASPEKIASHAPEIVASIDAGRPVVVYDPGLNCAVVYGYEEDGRRLLLRQHGASTILAAGEIGPMIVLLAKHEQPLPTSEALVRACRTAVRNWQREPLAAEKGSYAYGEAALKAWAEDVGKADTCREEEQKHLFFVSWWCFGSLADARNAAVDFLREHADDFPDAAQRAARRAVDAYAREGSMLGGVFGSKDGFLGPWSGKGLADWTPAVRSREQQVLAEARALEAEAIRAVESILAVLV